MNEKNSDKPVRHKMIQALYRQPHEGVPVWFMRQAGRYLPGYQAVRKKTEFLTLCKTPELAAEVTLEPLDTFGVDAVIIFSDILVVLEAMGLPVVFTDRGPCMETPLSTRADIEALRDPDPLTDTGYVMETIREVRKRVAGRVPVIGFSGAPFTLACYGLEGSPSRTFMKAMSLAYQEPKTMHLLLEKITDAVIRYAKAQVDAGAEVIQIFDSWGGMLPWDKFEEYSLQYCRRIMAALEGCGVPRILFIKGAGIYLNDVVECGSEGVGVDQNTPPRARAREVIGGRAAIQGNLPPEALLGPEEPLRAKVRELLEVYGRDPGYVFNLGHGILPPTPVSNVRAVVEEVHAFRG